MPGLSWRVKMYVCLLFLGQPAYRLPHPALLLHTHLLTMFSTS